MRRFVPALTGLLISGMLFALVGCGNEGTGKETQSELNNGTQQESDTTENSSTEIETGTETNMEGVNNTEIETSTESDTPTESETQAESESEKPVSYTYVSLDKTMWASDVLNVRGEPSAEGERIGQLTYAQEVKVTGQCNETSWYRIDYNGKTGYVSNKFLVEEKPVSPEPSPTPDVSVPNPTVDASKDVNGKTPKKVGSLYVIGNAAFEAYSYNDSRGTTYADLITKVADSLKGVSNVYCMPIPLGSGVMVPEEYNGKVSIGDQGVAIDSVLGHMGTNVLNVDIYDTLKAHSNEYLYFRTDHHWTQLGAYYAYTEYCKTKGITAFELDHYKHVAYSGFVGSFYFKNYENNKSIVQPLYDSPDTVYTYAPVSNAKMTVTNTSGKSFGWPIIKDVSDYKSGVKYSCFIAGDNPFTIIENSDITDGSSCVVVKESYGNAFVPFMVDHYQTVYVIDQRYWDGNLIEFAREKQITDVIFANNLTAIGSKGQLANFRGIIE